MSTIQDVAKAAGVSVATVSRVFNNPEQVAPRTRERVREAIRAMHYQPNLLGRNLRRSETRIVLVLLQYISNPFYSQVVRGMEDAAHEAGYQVMLCDTNLDIERERVYIHMLKTRLVDGIIFTGPVIGGGELTELSALYPVVQCCEYLEDAPGVPSVSVDDEAAAAEAVGYLLSLGHRRIGMVTGVTGQHSPGRREIGYAKALAGAGIGADPDLMCREAYSYRGGIQACRALMALCDPPTAIFTVSDTMAIGCIHEAKKMGLAVPGDVAVMGFDDTGIASVYDPPLSSVGQPRYELGRRAMEIMLSRMGGEEMTGRVYMPHCLKVRASTEKTG